MKITLNYRHIELREPIEQEVAHHSLKLARLLKRYQPDLVAFHGSLEKHPRKTEYTFSANLSLPTGTLHASGVAPDARASVKVAFAELESQVTKHQARLRKDYQWKRKRSRSKITAQSGAPNEA